MKKQRDPLSGMAGTFWKFIIAAIFGAMISFVLFIIVLELANGDSFWFQKGAHVFWIIPVVWGVMGIFWYEKMLTVARDLVEWVCGVGDR